MNGWFPIETPRLLLREFRSTDESDIHAYASDPEVVRYVHWGPNTPEVTRAILAGFLKAQQHWPRIDIGLAIELKSEQRLIGAIEIRMKDDANRAADFGYVLNRSCWGRGYMTEAARAVLDAAFRELRLHRVWATCDPRNLASSRVLEKLGMRREALFRKDVLHKGEWRDSYLYAILAEEWPAASN
ncbi:MAG TPA: GNAT family N-acetyltransferase [Candidatus Acidoferrales bacterium]|nr:GNAT family N-acetyltransferase [Candidatus Acidoferrales bacterium]